MILCETQRTARKTDLYFICRFFYVSAYFRKFEYENHKIPTEKVGATEPRRKKYKPVIIYDANNAPAEEKAYKTFREKYPDYNGTIIILPDNK